MLSMFNILVKLLMFINAYLEVRSNFLADNKTRIIGGEECDDADYSFMVSLREEEDNHSCGGTLISSLWVLSAAHCHNFMKFALIGTWSRKEYREFVLVKVAKVKIHPEYSSSTLENDIALALLEEPIKNSSFVKIPDKMLYGDLIRYCSMALVMGWGVTNYLSDESPTKLNCVYLRVIPISKCEAKYQHPFSFKQTCAYMHGKDSCRGDSGGPLICGDVQYGIVSWGRKCAEDYPGVYIRIDQYLNFIQKTMRGCGLSISFSYTVLFYLLSFTKFF
nr:trypsin-like [Leptinotarsa decemlineata]